MEQLEDRHLVSDVEKRGRLVEYERASTLRERTGEPHALPFAARYRVDASLAQLAHTRRVDRFLDRAAIALAGGVPDAEMRESPERNVFETSHGKCKLLSLCDHSHARASSAPSIVARTYRRRECRRVSAAHVRSARAPACSSRSRSARRPPSAAPVARSALRPPARSTVARGYRTATSSNRSSETAAA